MDDYNQDYTKEVVITQLRKKTIRKVYVKKIRFTKRLTQKNSFNTIKSGIANNVVTKSDPEIQFYLIMDINQTAIEGILFEIHGTPIRTETTTQFSNQK